jgi:hypothetical protein
MALVVMMAVVMIAIPTCTMIGCDMGMGSGMPYMPSGSGIFNACPGEWTTNTGPAGVLPNAFDTMVLTLGAFVMAVAIVLSPRESARAVRVLASDPPPPPEDPLGQRARI